MNYCTAGRDLAGGGRGEPVEKYAETEMGDGVKPREQENWTEFLKCYGKEEGNPCLYDLLEVKGDFLELGLFEEAEKSNSDQTDRYQSPDR